MATSTFYSSETIAEIVHQAFVEEQAKQNPPPNGPKKSRKLLKKFVKHILKHLYVYVGPILLTAGFCTVRHYHPFRTPDLTFTQGFCIGSFMLGAIFSTIAVIHLGIYLHETARHWVND
jgi:hypothetical protein